MSHNGICKRNIFPSEINEAKLLKYAYVRVTITSTLTCHHNRHHPQLENRHHRERKREKGESYQQSWMSQSDVPMGDMKNKTDNDVC